MRTFIAKVNVLFIVINIVSNSAYVLAYKTKSNRLNPLILK